MEIIERSYVEEFVAYTRDFSWRDSPGAGFSFDCNEQGEIDRSDFFPEAVVNLRKCLDGTFDVIDHGVEKREWSYRHPSVGLCVCGREVVLDGFTCPCECGRDYNSGGQLLAPREQWGEETGEHLADILRIR